MLTRDEIAQALRAREAELVTDGNYQNQAGMWGYHATVHCVDHWYMVSVSSVEGPIDPSEIADAIESPQATVLGDGYYQNRRGQTGYYIQIECDGRTYKVSISGVEAPSGRSFNRTPWWE